MDQGPLSTFPDPYGNGFHVTATIGFAVARGIVKVKTVQTDWAVVAVLSPGASVCHPFAAILAAEQCRSRLAVPAIVFSLAPAIRQFGIWHMTMFELFVNIQVSCRFSGALAPWSKVMGRETPG